MITAAMKLHELLKSKWSWPTQPRRPASSSDTAEKDKKPSNNITASGRHASRALARADGAGVSTGIATTFIHQTAKYPKDKVAGPIF
jgi:hypothetical protein